MTHPLNSLQEPLTNLWRNRRSIQYLFGELLPTFSISTCILLAVAVFTQTSPLATFILNNGADLKTCLEVLLYLSLSIFPIVLPTGILLATLLTYGRLSAYSEIIALRGLGLKNSSLIFPPLILGLVMSLVSTQISFHLAPWGFQRMRETLHRAKQLKPTLNLKEGVFIEAFHMVFYINHINKKSGDLKEIFIHDERRKDFPTTIVAQSGNIVTKKHDSGFSAYLQLSEGSIHRNSEQSYTKIDFDTSEVTLHDLPSLTTKGKNLQSYTLNELQSAMDSKTLPAQEINQFKIEFHRRWSLSIVSLLLSILGVGLGIRHHRQGGISTGIVISVGITIIYWALQAGLENTARNNTWSPAIIMWIPNCLLILGAWFSIKSLRKS